MKRLLLIALATIVAISTIFGSTLGVSAAGRFESEWGTVEEGVVSPEGWQDYAGYYENCPGTTGFPNGDFEQGLKYWTTPRGKYKAVDTVEIVEENGNHFMRFSCDEAWQGIESLRFVDSRVKAGDNLAIMYKWRSDDPNFQLILQQYRMEPPSIGDIKRVSMGKGVNLVEATTDGEWNVSMTATKSGDDPRIGIVQEPLNDTKTVYLSYLLQVCSDPTTVADIDDLSLVIYNENTGKVFDLDGKELYDVNNLSNDVEDVIDSEDFADIDYDVENEKLDLENEQEETEEVSEKTDTKKNGIVAFNPFSVDNWQNDNLWKVAIVTAGAVIIVAAIVVAVIIIVKIRKKKTGDVIEEQPTEELFDETKE